MPAPGLCGVCEHARVLENRRRSRFYLCELSRVDPRYPRYPPLPVLACIGFRPRSEEGAAAETPVEQSLDEHPLEEEREESP